MPKPGDVAIIVYTSGTTGPSKGAMLTHRNIIFQIGAFKRIGLPLSETDEALNFLPLCHVAERFGGCYNHIAAMHVVNFAEAPDTVPQNLREVAPHIFLAVPRVWEKLYSAVTIQIKEGTALGPPRLQGGHRRRLQGQRLRARGQARAGAAARWRAPSATGWCSRTSASCWASTASAGRSPARRRSRPTSSAGTGRWASGCTRSTGRPRTPGSPPRTIPGHSRSAPSAWRRPAPSSSCRRRARSCCAGPHIFEGYLNKPEKTAEALQDGWLHTGDVGVIDNQGFVRITDRMKDIIITAGGKNITPSEIENQLKFSPYISDAVVIGDKRSYLTCLIMIDHDNVVKFAQDHDVPFTNYASLCRAPEVQ